ncbi:MAG: hypothetical protein IH946_06560 [Bacteroidetes bacterium]|nr:hypothetical protein [Bacteroidota bacterium]
MKSFLLIFFLSAIILSCSSEQKTNDPEKVQSDGFALDPNTRIIPADEIERKPARKIPTNRSTMAVLGITPDMMTRYNKAQSTGDNETAAKVLLAVLDSLNNVPQLNQMLAGSTGKVIWHFLIETEFTQFNSNGAPVFHFPKLSAGNPETIKIIYDKIMQLSQTEKAYKDAKYPLILCGSLLDDPEDRSFYIQNIMLDVPGQNPAFWTHTLFDYIGFNSDEKIIQSVFANIVLEMKPGVILQFLTEKGFVVMKLGKPIKYLAVPPKEVLERVKKNVSDDAKEQIKMLEDLKKTEVVTELNTLHSQGIELVEPADLSGSLKGRHNLYNHLELTIRNAEEAVSIMTTTQGLMRKIEGFKPTFEKLKKRGVKIRIAAPLTKETISSVKDMGSIAEIKHTDIKARFVIVDGKEIVFMIMDDKEVHPTYDVGIWVNSPFFSSALTNLFNTSWKSMKTSGDALRKY